MSAATTDNLPKAARWGTGNYANGPKGKWENGSVYTLLGKPAAKPRKFLTWRDGTTWHWWNKRAAFELCRDLQATPRAELPPAMVTLLEALQLAFGQPDERRAAA